MALMSDIVAGANFGRLTVVGIRKVSVATSVGAKKRRTLVDCECVCGNKSSVDASSLGRNTTSCGCAHRDIVTTHGLSAKDQRLYYIWHGLNRRCYSEAHKSFGKYGGRGIAVCQEWRETPDAFFQWSYANGYQDNLSIDRINNDGNYEPSNCRWATNGEQMNNIGRNVSYTAWGETKKLAEWLRDSRCVMKRRRSISHRINVYDWSPERAMSTPLLTDAKDYRRSGRRRRNGKLDIETAKLIKGRIEAGDVLTHIAKDFDISVALVSSIKLGKAWRAA